MRFFGILALSAVAATPAIAGGDAFHVTASEKAACTSDAVRFCMSTYPDEMKLLGCMKQNRELLSDVCRVAFDAGIKRRHL